MCVTSQAEQFCLLSETLPLLTLHFMGLSDPFSNVFSFCAEASALFSFVLSLGSNFCMQAVSLVGMLGTGNFQALLPNLQRRNDFSAVPKVFVCVSCILGLRAQAKFLSIFSVKLCVGRSIMAACTTCKK